ncbi:hypothetical protein IU444_28970 [Nocardia farcinica]|uniref:hypothetical protein n=1 Tax=Nocardia farcinica TaxID=37329 RepID=UPI0018958D6F|nr:hypothetical protein [Nocardia farcinica]MBF6388164.1 hypothetical protein [Nocardia farcinica]
MIGIHGTILRISDVKTYPDNRGGARKVIYMTVVDEHDSDGGTAKVKTKYEVSFSSGDHPERIYRSYRPGDAVVILADGQRIEQDAERKYEPRIVAQGRRIGLSSWYSVLDRQPAEV